MDEDALETFCSHHLTKIHLAGFKVDWDFPGHLTLTPEGGAGTLGIVVTPDFLNGEPTRIVVQIDVNGGERCCILDEVDVTWTGDVATDEKTWRDVVEANRPRLEQAIALAREGKDPVALLGA